MLIFLHIPKTAGSTLVKILEQQYPAQALFKRYGRRPHTPLQEYQALLPNQQAAVRVFSSHMDFGVHEFLPPPPTYFTVLRDPIDRIISHYYYVLRKPDHSLYPTITQQCMSLQTYMQAGLSTELDNGQTRQLAGALGPISQGTNRDECTPEMLERAKHNLQTYFPVTGLTEEFDTTLILLKRTFGWRTPFYVKENVTHNRPQASDLPAQTLEVIAQYNQLDVPLYAYARDLLNEAVARQDRSFAQEVKAFKCANALYGRAYVLASSAIRIARRRLNVAG